MHLAERFHPACSAVKRIAESGLPSRALIRPSLRPSNVGAILFGAQPGVFASERGWGSAGCLSRNLREPLILSFAGQPVALLLFR